MASNRRIRGITIEIDGDTVKLTDALKQVNTELSKTSGALKDVENLLKVDPGNVDLLRQKQTLLTTAIEDTKKKLEQEKEALRQAAETAPNYNAWKQANEPIQNSINETRDRLKDLKEQAEKTYEAMSEGRATQEQYDAIQAEIKQTQDKLKDLREEQKRVGDEFGNPLSTDQYQALQREIQDTENSLRSLTDQYRDFGSVAAQQIAAVGDKMQDFGGKVTDAGKALAPVSAAAAGFLGLAAKSAIDYETAFSGVMKTVDETATTTYDDISDGIKQLATETASTKEEIAGVAEISGQLGVAADNILDFTETAVKLGDTTNLSAEDAATALARLFNVTGTSQDKIKNAGSAVVALGNNFATTETEITEMAQRLAGAGSQIGLSVGEILGISTALSSVGIEAEMGGSAFSKAMVKMQVASETGYEKVNDLMSRVSEATGKSFDSFREFQLYWKNMSGLEKMPVAESLGMLTSEINTLVNTRAELESFADVSGMTAEQFVTAFKGNAVDALMAFIGGLANTEERGESTIQMLQDMGFTEVRLRDALTRAANANDIFTDAVNMGNQAFEENIALDEEAAKKYETTAAQISQTKESVTNLLAEIGENGLPIIKDLLEAIKSVTSAFSGLDEKTQDNIIRVALLVAGISPVLLVLGNVISSIGTILTLAPMLLSPIGLIVAAVAGLIAIITTLYATNEDFRNLVDEAWTKIKEKISGVIEAVKGVIRAFIDLVSAWWDKWGDTILGYTETAFRLITDTISAGFEIIEGIFDVITGILTGDWEKLWEGLKKIATGIVDEIVAKVNALFGFISNVIDALRTLIGLKKKVPEDSGGGGGSFGSSSTVAAEAPVRSFASGYQTPYILTSPTIFGASGGRALLGGDGPGGEVVAGFDLLRDMMQSTMSQVLAAAGASTPPVINLTVDVGGQFFDRRVIQATQNYNYRSGGR